MDETPDGGAKRDSLHEAPTPWRAADGKRTGRDPSSSSSSSSSSRSSDAATRKPSSSRRLVERGLGRRQECGKGANFFIESRSFPRSEGCYKPLSQYNGEAMYRQARKCESCNYVVGATQGDNKNPDELRWSLVYAEPEHTEESFSVCQSVQIASSSHPATAIWACDASGTGGLTIASSNSFRVSCGCPSDQDDMQLLGEPEPLLGSRAVWGGVIFVFGIFSLCFALWLKLTGRRKKFRQQQLKFARVGSAEDSL